ncbi:MAG: hypothetical protein V9G14_04680 [Cypionkella sp.]|nr:hypothetical protein [Cypionkella sp.]
MTPLDANPQHSYLQTGTKAFDTAMGMWQAAAFRTDGPLGLPEQREDHATG